MSKKSPERCFPTGLRKDLGPNRLFPLMSRKTPNSLLLKTITAEIQDKGIRTKSVKVQTNFSSSVNYKYIHLDNTSLRLYLSNPG